MTTRLWIETTYHAAFRLGGWAYVCEVGGHVTGYAGGDRNLTGERLLLAGMAAAIKDIPAGPVKVLTANPALMAIGRALLAPPSEPPAEDLDLWAQLLSAAKGRSLSFAVAQAGPKTPAAFLAAWAEVGQTRAKVAGRFTAAIPKSNLSTLNLG